MSVSDIMRGNGKKFSLIGSVIAYIAALQLPFL